MNYKKYRNKENKPTRHGFGEGLREAGYHNDKIVALGADITGSVSVNFFKETFPDRFYSIGIAEQNATGIAAGMALSGLIPVFATYGVFSAMRNTDQLRISICYNNVHAIIGGAHAGISVGPDGATHQALEDIAITRSLPNMTVLSPCDADQTHKAFLAAVNDISGPVYIRFGREKVPNFTGMDLPIENGKGQVLKPGNDLTIIATGHMVWHALQAAYQLEKDDIHARVINIHTIKPIDKDIIINAAKETGKIITAEEHQITGGLGSAVTEITSEFVPVPVKIIGMPDCFGESGKPEELMKKYGLSAENIIHHAKSFLSHL
ncbi:MAG: transketolase family protein [Bacteroidales bacterium]|nr:transketolase family protein [Bacteroidales bacterium]MCF8328124.1 transketolase family protein [Bacteroidales bacterium]